MYGYDRESLRGAVAQLSAGIGFAQPQTPDIPKYLWYKLGPKGLNEETRAWTATCIEQNPDHKVEFITEASADSFVQATFGESDPDLVQVYLDLPSMCT